MCQPYIESATTLSDISAELWVYSIKIITGLNLHILQVAVLQKLGS